MGDETRWLSVPRFATDQSRADHSAPILERMRAWCAERTTAQAIASLEQAGIPAGPILTPQQALDDPQVAAMQFLSAVDGYPGLKRAAQVSDLPVRFGRIEGGIARPPPQAGEHSAAILGELGYSAAEIAALKAISVIG